MKTETDDLTLKELNQHYGTFYYYPFGLGNTKITDGVAYIVGNGYHWFVSDLDVISLMKPKIKNEGFLVFKLKVNEDKTATATITDGNKKTLYTQKYEYTNAKVKELTLYKQNNIIMLAQEY